MIDLFDKKNFIPKRVAQEHASQVLLAVFMKNQLFIRFLSKKKSKTVPSNLRNSTLRGFSLIEVMVSSALLMVAISGTLSAFSTATRVYEHQRKTTLAITLAESTIEDLLLRFQGDKQIKVSGSEYGPHCYSRAGRFLKDASSSSCPGGTYYRVTWSSKNSSLVGIAKLEAIVRWNETAGPKDLRLSTLRN